MGADEVIQIRGDQLTKVVMKAGNGDSPPPGVTVKVHYVGTLENGEQFDSSVERNRPFSFRLGAEEVIKGWDLGVATMTKGERAIFTIAPNLAYGTYMRARARRCRPFSLALTEARARTGDIGAGGMIPPRATLKFQVELLEWGEKVGEPEAPRALVVLGIFIVIWVAYNVYTEKDGWIGPPKS